MSWKTAFLLSIIIPTGLLLTFKFTGMIGEPTITESITLDPIVWTFQRPNDFVIINQKFNVTYADDGISLCMYLLVIRFENESQFIGGHDYLHISMAINATTNIQNGFIEQIHLTTHKDKESAVDWEETDLNYENMSLAARADGYRWNTEAYVKLAGVNNTSSISAKAMMQWYFYTPKTQSQQLEIVYEIVYYDGQGFSRLVQPFQLSLIGAS